MSIGCPSVVRRRSRRRLRNGLREPSIGLEGRPASAQLKAHDQRSAVSAARRLPGTKVRSTRIPRPEARIAVALVLPAAPACAQIAAALDARDIAFILSRWGFLDRGT